MISRFLLLLIFLNTPIYYVSASEIYSYSKDSNVIGELQTYQIKNNESLIEIARKFKIGYNEITDANPKLDPFIPGNEKIITISTQWVLPDVPTYKGIVINLSEMRLFYFTKDKVMTYAIGIGDEGKRYTGR